MKIRKCIIPAAGLGTRFLPATKALPKEMFPVVDKPVMQMLVEEAISIGVEEIIIVTGRNKRAIEDHFDSNIELEERLMASGKEEELKKIKEITTLANFVYIRQPYPRGDGDAILRAKNLIGNEPFLVLFGDDIVDGKKTASLQLLEAFKRKNSTVIATVKVSDAEVSSYGIIETVDNNKDIFTVSKLLEKPNVNQTKSRYGIIGKYILNPDIFCYLEKAEKNKKSGEIRLSDALELLRKEKDIYGVNIYGERFDTGSKIGYLKAIIHYGLKDKSLQKELKNYLNSINSR